MIWTWLALTLLWLFAYYNPDHPWAPNRREMFAVTLIVCVISIAREILT